MERLNQTANKIQLGSNDDRAYKPTMASFAYFVLSRKAWSWPKQSAVLIYDACGQENFLEYLRPWNPEVLHVRGEQINMRVLWSSLFRPGKKTNAYLDCFIERVCPRLIVTFIDNNPRFYSLAVRHKNIKTLFIQNGIRGSEVFDGLDYKMQSEGLFKVDYMMTFGGRIGAEYARYIQGAVVPMGGFINNLVSKHHTKEVGTIAFVSQYRKDKGVVVGGNYYSRQEFFVQADQLVLGFLVKYAQKYGKNLLIIPCSSPDNKKALQEERKYYDKLLGQNCDFSKGTTRYASYYAADSAEVVVGIDSTFGYESAARGNKTAIFSIRTQLLGMADRAYGWPGSYSDEGPFWINRPDTAGFERILDHLFAINEKQWEVELAEQGFANIMAYDPGNSILKTILDKELGDI